jgi:hypothetical protein
MKTIPVDHMSTMPMLLVFELITALIILTVGIVLVNKLLQNDRKKLLFASGLVGLVAGAAMVGVFFGVDSHVSSTNDANFRAAVTESAQNLNEEQIVALQQQGFITLDEDKSVSYSDEGNGYNLTVFDASENTEAQTELEEKRDQQLKDNDF